MMGVIRSWYKGKTLGLLLFGFGDVLAASAPLFAPFAAAMCVPFHPELIEIFLSKIVVEEGTLEEAVEAE